MPLIALQIFSWITSGWTAWVAPLLAKIPWQVWAAIAGIIAVLVYGHIRENRGYAKCQAAVKEATDKELARQAKVSSDAVNAAQGRIKQSEQKQQEAQANADDLQKQVDALKEANTQCIPDNIGDQLRNRTKRVPNNSIRRGSTKSTEPTR